MCEKVGVRKDTHTQDTGSKQDTRHASKPATCKHNDHANTVSLSRDIQTRTHAQNISHVVTNGIQYRYSIHSLMFLLKILSFHHIGSLLRK